MNKKLIIALSAVSLMAMPLAAMAAFDPGGTPNSVNLNIVQIINIILNFMWPIFAGFAVIMFLVAGFIFLTASGDPGKVETARQAVLWGVVGVVVGLIAFSIPLIIRQTLGSGI